MCKEVQFNNYVRTFLVMENAGLDLGYIISANFEVFKILLFLAVEKLEVCNCFFTLPIELFAATSYKHLFVLTLHLLTLFLVV